MAKYSLSGIYSNKYGLLTRLSDSARALVKNPITILLLFLAIGVYFSYTKDANNNVITDLVNKLAEYPVLNTTKEYISQHKAQCAGLTFFFPTVASSPRNLQLFLAIAVFCWIMYAPAHSMNQYAFQSLLVFLFFRPQLESDRPIMVIFLLLLIYMGQLTPATPSRYG